MSKKDKIKEEINDLRFWLGTFVAISITLGGWIITNRNNYKDILFVIACIIEIFVLIRTYILNKKIKKRIQKLEEL